MPKNSDGNKFNKIQSRLQKQGQHQGHGGQRDMGPGNANDNRQPDRQPDREQTPDIFDDRQARRDQFPDSMGERQQMPGLNRLLRNARGMRQENQDRNTNMPDANARGNNCLSRVLMMALPLMAIGAYLFIR